MSDLPAQMEALIKTELTRHGGADLRWERAPASEGYDPKTGAATWGWQTCWADQRFLVFLRPAPRHSPNVQEVAMEWYAFAHDKPVPAVFRDRLNETVVKLFAEAAKSPRLMPWPHFEGDDTPPPAPAPTGPLALQALLPDFQPKHISRIKHAVRQLVPQWLADQAELTQLRKFKANLEGLRAAVGQGWISEREFFRHSEPGLADVELGYFDPPPVDVEPAHVRILPAKAAANREELVTEVSTELVTVEQVEERLGVRVAGGRVFKGDEYVDVDGAGVSLTYAAYPGGARELSLVEAENLRDVLTVACCEARRLGNVVNLYDVLPTPDCRFGNICYCDPLDAKALTPAEEHEEAVGRG